MLRRLSAWACRCALIDSGRAPERVDAVLEVTRWRAAGMALRLGHESVGCRCTEVGRDCEGLAEGEDVDVEMRARLRPW